MIGKRLRIHLAKPRTVAPTIDRRNAGRLAFGWFCLQLAELFLDRCKTTEQPPLRFADPSRQSILFPSLADAAREAPRTLPSLRRSTVRRFYGELERGRLDYHAGDPREPSPYAIHSEASRKRIPIGGSGESESARCEKLKQKGPPCSNQSPQPLPPNLPTPRPFPSTPQKLPTFPLVPLAL